MSTKYYQMKKDEMKAFLSMCEMTSLKNMLCVCTCGWTYTNLVESLEGQTQIC